MQENATVATAVRTERGNRRWKKVLALIGGAVMALMGLLAYMGMFWGNVRAVESGDLYRSAQLTDGHLQRVLREDHIRSVINLRGRLPEDRAYQGELATCAAMGVAHVDVSLSASRLPPPRQLRALLNAYDRMPRPILIHCAGGADRSGLAATIYEIIYKKRPLDAAEGAQLTWRYGHIPFGSAHPMDDFFTLYRKTGERLGLREWILTTYPTIYAQSDRHP